MVIWSIREVEKFRVLIDILKVKKLRKFPKIIKMQISGLEYKVCI